MAKTKTVSKKAAKKATTPAVAVATIAPTAPLPSAMDVAALQQRIRALETENRLLSEQIGRLTRGRPE